MWGVNDRHRVDARQQLVVDLPGVGGHLNDHGVSGGERLLDPAFQIGELHTLRTGQRSEIGIHAHGDHVVLVDIETDETDGGRFSGDMDVYSKW
jgi:hypothetical protein